MARAARWGQAVGGRLILACLLMGVGLGARVSAAADDENATTTIHWPRFRGPNGIATAHAQLPVQWKPDHILWKTPLKSIGNSSPIVWGDRIYVASARDQGSTRLLLCYSATSGKLVWEAAFSGAGHKKHQKNSFATATPTTDGTHVYCAYTAPGSFKVYCVNNEGQKVWEHEMGDFQAGHGSGASPILYRDLVVMANDQDGPSSVVALDKQTGKVRWSSPRVRDKAAYTTPFVLTGSTSEQLILSSSTGISSLDPQNGEQHWDCPLFDARAVGSPFLADGLVMGICGSGSKGSKLIAVRPDGKGNVANTHLAWQTARTLPYCVTPVSHGPHVFMVTDIGVARCILAKTGEEIWTQRLEGKFSSSPILVGDRIYALGENGDVFIFAASTKFELLARNRLEDYFVSTPAVANHRLFLRGEQFLWCVGNK